MKKLITIVSILILASEANAQFVNGIGVTVGVGAGNQKFFYHDPLALSRKKYIVGFNASVFGEFLSHDYWRWVTEIQYDQKGSVDKRPEGSYGNSLQYISWNNYAKVRYEMYSIIPYIMIGPKLEYRMTQAIQSPDVTGSYKPLHVSAALGGGFEVVSYSNWKFLVEAFYNPDLSAAYVSTPLHVKNKNIELRVGVKYEFGRKEQCNTPTYVE